MIFFFFLASWTIFVVEPCKIEFIRIIWSDQFSFISLYLFVHLMKSLIHDFMNNVHEYMYMIHDTWIMKSFDTSLVFLLVCFCIMPFIHPPKYKHHNEEAVHCSLDTFSLRLIFSSEESNRLDNVPLPLWTKWQAN